MKKPPQSKLGKDSKVKTLNLSDLFLTKSYFYFLLATILLITYFPVFNAGYSDDDWRTAGQNEQVKKGFDGIQEIWTSSWAQSRDKSNFVNNWEYRPMAKTSFAIEYAIFGDQPAIAHFFNLLYFLILLILIHETLLYCGLEPWSVKLALLILLVHPLSVEVVANLKNREILFAFGFAFAAAYILHSKLPISLQFFLYLLFSVLSILSKVQALPLLVVFPFYKYYQDRKLLKWSMLSILLTLLAVAIISQFPNDRTYLYWENPMFFENGLLLRLETFLKTVGFYWTKFFIPSGLMHYYGYDIFQRGNWFTTYIFAGFIGLFILLTYAFINRKNLLALLHLLSFLSISAMVSNAILPAAGIVADRFGFLFPLYFFILLFHLSQNFWSRYIKIFTPAFVCVCLLFTVLSFQRCKDWKNYYTTYTASLQHGEHSAKVQSMAAQQFMRMSGNPELSIAEQQTMVDTAMNCLNKALHILPSMEGMHNNIGFLLTKKEKFADAEKEYVAEMCRNPYYVNAYLNLAFERIRAGKPRQALSIYYFLHQNKTKMIGRYFDSA